MTNTAQLIRRARKRKKWSPAEFARRMKRSRSTVHAWEHDGPGPKLDIVEEIAEVLDLESADLVASLMTDARRRSAA